MFRECPSHAAWAGPRGGGAPVVLGGGPGGGKVSLPPRHSAGTQPAPTSPRKASSPLQQTCDSRDVSAGVWGWGGGGAWRERPGGLLAWRASGLASEKCGDFSGTSGTWPLPSTSTWLSTAAGQGRFCDLPEREARSGLRGKGQGTQAFLCGGNRCGEGGCGKNWKVLERQAPQQAPTLGIRGSEAAGGEWGPRAPPWMMGFRRGRE